MIASNRVNYSKYIRPIILMDLLIISILGFIYLNIKYLTLGIIIYLFDNRLVCCCYINYNVYRFTALIEIISK
jgi:hypothetical protein